MSTASSRSPVRDSHAIQGIQATTSGAHAMASSDTSTIAAGAPMNAYVCISTHACAEAGSMQTSGHAERPRFWKYCVLERNVAMSGVLTDVCSVV